MHKNLVGKKVIVNGNLGVIISIVKQSITNRIIANIDMGRWTLGIDLDKVKLVD